MRLVFHLVTAALLCTAAIASADTIVHVTSETGDYVGQGREHTYTPDTHTLTIRRNYDNGVTVSVNGANWWTLNFAAPGGVDLSPGVYEGATRFLLQSAAEPGLSVAGDGRGCYQLTGRFEVYEAVYDRSTGNVLQFAADYEQHCEGGEPALVGQVRWQSDLPLAPTVGLGEPMLLTGLSATASSTFYSSYYAPHNAVDTELNTFWVGGFRQSNWTFTVDLGGSHLLSDMAIDWYYLYGATDFDIAYSEDGVTFLPLYTELSEPGGETAPYITTTAVSMHQVQASHVRVVIHSANRTFPAISELRIMGWMPTQ